MTVITHAQWGLDIPTPTIDPGEEKSEVSGAVPRAPGCTELLEAPAATVRNLKYYVRCNANVDTAANSHVQFSCYDADSNMSFTLPVLTNDWDHDSTAAHRQPTYPNEGNSFSEDWDRDVCLPGSHFSLMFYLEDAMTPRCVNGAAIGVRWDNANPSENVPIWDWSSPAISESQMPASSVVVMKALCETYNRILYGAVWEIEAAFPSMYGEA